MDTSSDNLHMRRPGHDKEMETSIAAQNNAIRTHNIKSKINKWKRIVNVSYVEIDMKWLIT